MVKRINDEVPDTLMLVEHQATYTVGRRRESKDNLLNPQSVPVVEVERGGDVTFHGPGQLTGYPIVKLPPHRHDLHAYLHFLEDFWIDFLADRSVAAQRDARNTGVWVQDKKMVAIGIACRRWVTWHGFACNVDVDLEYYRRINPCGMSSSLVTNLSAHHETPSLDAFASAVGSAFSAAWQTWAQEP